MCHSGPAPESVRTTILLCVDSDCHQNDNYTLSFRPHLRRAGLSRNLSVANSFYFQMLNQVQHDRILLSADSDFQLPTVIKIRITVCRNSAFNTLFQSELLSLSEEFHTFSNPSIPRRILLSSKNPPDEPFTVGRRQLIEILFCPFILF